MVLDLTLRHAHSSQHRQVVPCIVSSLISGQVATALAMQPGGAVGRLRKVIAGVLKENVQVVRAMPPSQQSSQARHRAAVLDLVLPRTVPGEQRRHTLETSLNSDWSSDNITLYWLEEQPPDLTRWSERVAQALLPAAVPAFPRNRRATTCWHVVCHCGLLLFAAVAFAQKISGQPAPLRPRRATCGRC